MKKKYFIFLLLIAGFAQAQTPSKPKLVVGIVIDQMRWDYLYRFSERYAADGFKRMLREGFSCENTFIPYTPAHTAPGHASVYTGSIPSLNGIMGNQWYDRTLKRVVYCVEDSTVATVGSKSTEGEMSPRNMWASTITDELRISNQFKSKTISIGLKDRGAILPAGHTANAAYWFDESIGGWVTSTYYMKEMPQWMVQLNAKKLPDTYMARSWKTLYPLDTYVQSTADAKAYEGALPGEDETFEHKTESITGNKYYAFQTTPYGNSFTMDAAKAAIEGEGLGTRGVSDFLALSFSSPDYAGHTFGPNSIEIEDMYLRLDKDLTDFMTYLDTKVGKGQYLLFLTADHAVAHVPGFMTENKLPGGTSSSGALQKALTEALQKEFGNGAIIERMINYQVFLNHDFIQSKGLDRGAVKRSVIQALLRQPGIDKAIDLENVTNTTLPLPLKTVLFNSYNQRLSGDVQYVYKPQWIEAGQKGTTHGSWNPYDSHIPLLWFGWGIKQGKTNRETYMTDIAPTLAALLHIQMPNASVGKVIEEVKK